MQRIIKDLNKKDANKEEMNKIIEKGLEICQIFDNDFYII